MAYRDPFTGNPTLVQKLTDDGGLAVWLLNDSGAAIDRGYVVKVNDVDSFDVAAIDDESPSGVVLEDIAKDEYGWVVVSGIAYVWNNLAGGVTAGDWLRVSLNTDANKLDGAAIANAGPIVLADDPEYAMKIGQALETTTADGLVRTLIRW